MSWFEAAAYAELAGKSLPTAYHWYFAAQADRIGPLSVPGSNFQGEGTRAVGGPGTLSGFGTTDMAGNVKEWCWNQGPGERRLILGGGFGEQPYMFLEGDSQPPWDRRPNYGFRCAKLSSPPPPVAAARIEPETRDFSKENPASDEVFAVFRRLYSYDKGELNARIHETETTEEWTRQKVSFDAAYGGERMSAHLFLPKNVVPPYQAVVYFPGSGAQLMDKFDTAYFYGNDWVPKGGRALLFPIYKGTFERRDEPDEPNVPRPKELVRARRHRPHQAGLLRVQLGDRDLAVPPGRRGPFQGRDPGGGRPLPGKARAGIRRGHYLPRVKISVLMLNGRYDAFFPIESSQLAFLRRLGTPEADRKHVVYEDGHTPPNREGIRECLAWLDRYLGPVRRR